MGNIIRNLWRSIFNILIQHRNTRKKVVFYLEMERFLPIIGDKSRKSDCATDESLSNFVRSSSDVESGTHSQMRCQHLTNSFGVWVRLELCGPL